MSTDTIFFPLGKGIFNWMDSDCNLLFCYAWDDHQPRIRALVKLLQVYRGINVLMDIDDEFQTEASNERFQSASFVIIFLSSAMKNSDRCRTIFSKTSAFSKKVVLFTLEDDFEVNGWIKHFLVESKKLEKSITFLKDSSNYEEIINSLLKAISSSSQTPLFLEKSSEIVVDKMKSLETTKAKLDESINHEIPNTEDERNDDRKSYKQSFCGRQIKVYYQHDRNSHRLDDIFSILCHLADRQLILVKKYEANVDFSILFIENDFINDEAAFQEEKHLIIDFRSKMECYNHCGSCFHLPAASVAFPELLQKLEEIISEILTLKASIPKPSTICTIGREQDTDKFRNFFLEFCDPSTECCLAIVNGESGVGKTDFVARFLHEESTLITFGCGIQTILWLNVSNLLLKMKYPLKQSEKQGSSQMFDEDSFFENIFNELNPIIEPKSKLNFHSLFLSERRCFGRTLLVLDNFTSNADFLNLIMKYLTKISPNVLRVMGLGDVDVKIEDEQVTCFSLPNLPLVISQRLMEQKLSWKLDRQDIGDLAEVSFGSPLMTQILCSHLEDIFHLSIIQNEMEAGHYCGTLVSLLKKSTAVKKSNHQQQQVLMRLFKLSFEDEKSRVNQSEVVAFCHFLLFEPGHMLEAVDLAILWNCETEGAERLLNVFYHRCFTIRRYHQNGRSGKWYFQVPKMVWIVLLDYMIKSKLFSSIEQFLKTTINNEKIYNLSKYGKIQILISLFEQLDGDFLSKNLDLLFQLQSFEHFFEIFKIFIVKGVDPMYILQQDEIYFKFYKSLKSNLTLLHSILRYKNIRPCRLTLLEEKKENEKFWFELARDSRTDPLLVSAIRNEKNRVKHLINMPNCYLDRPNPNGQTALIAACANGNVEIVEQLVKAGANVNATDRKGLSPLMYASMGNHKEVIRVLFNLVQVNTPVVDVNLTERINGFTSLMYAAMHGHVKVVETLRKHPYVIIDESTNHDGISALMLAAKFGHSSIVEYLAINGASTSASMDDGTTTLMLACENGHLNVVKFLVMFGCGDLDMVRRDGVTALMLAASGGYDKIVQTLRINGAAVTSTADGHFGRTAFHFAALNGYPKVIETLHMTGLCDVNLQDYSDGNLTPLLMACEQGHIAVVQSLVSLGADVNYRETVNGRSPIQLAAQSGHYEVVDYLLTKNVDLSCSNSDRCLKNALILAAENGSEQCVWRLLKSDEDIDVNASDDTGKTAFDYALAHGYYSICRILADNGANIPGSDVNFDVLIKNQQSKFGPEPMNPPANIEKSAILENIPRRVAFADNA